MTEGQVKRLAEISGRWIARAIIIGTNYLLYRVAGFDIAVLVILGLISSQVSEGNAKRK